MRTYKKYLSLFLAFTILFTSLPTVVFASKIDNDYNFDIIKGAHDNQIIIIENGESFTLETVLENGFQVVNVYDESGNLLSSDKTSFSDFNAAAKTNVVEDDQFSGCSLLATSGNGTKENPYRYCTPGTAQQYTEKVSYGTILGMAGAAVTTVAITKALVAYLGIAAITFSSTAGKELVASIFGVLSSTHSSSWLNTHGVSMYIRTECTLQNYVDNAWGENIWFYGKTSKILRHSTY